MQLPLQTVDMINGPTSLCPATHSEVFCKRGLTLSSAYLALCSHSLTHHLCCADDVAGLLQGLRGVCLEQTRRQAARAIDAMEAYVRLWLYNGQYESYGTSSAKQQLPIATTSPHCHPTHLPSIIPAAHTQVHRSVMLLFMTRG